MTVPSLSRRQILQRSALLPLSAGVALTASATDAAPAGTSDILVAYLTRTGNTQVIARFISRIKNADLFEIRTGQPYPEEYDAMVAQAEREREQGFEPTLTELVPNVARYRMVFLGFPIWGMTAPAPIRSFLSNHDLSGKTIVPFITHGGYGAGSSLQVIAEQAPSATLADAFVLEADQERRTRDQTRHWLMR